jgi:hypothetical protein
MAQAGFELNQNQANSQMTSNWLSKAASAASSSISPFASS